ncbi:MAG: SDR family oxidoreductase [Acidimicrobiia bacterium]|nr:SDR family oxidoreductase [Acidimicrobiia bacterium]
MDLGLTGRRIIVTGASRGIGKAIVEALAREGAHVAICARGAGPLAELIEALSVAGHTAFGSTLDVTDDAACRNWINEAVAKLGGLDGVVSNVSARVPGLELEKWRGTFEIDLLQHVRIAELALPHLPEGGSVVFVSSIAAMLTRLAEEERAYGPMKAALNNYAAQLAQVHGRSGIRVNTVSPGPVFFEGGVWDHIATAQPKLLAAAEKLTALGRLGRPEEVAAAVTFLSSPRASFITGANIRIDGGAMKSVGQ